MLSPDEGCGQRVCPFCSSREPILDDEAAWLFGDPLSLGQVAGSLLIIAGVSVNAFVR